ncbi:Endoribonuclease YbeY [Caulifigura coniformis]|uniref:Endoribonuclease YbeY n=1 Tax=Caulifigura coniformis TaxID=2527983 RepID=A0A517SHH8_9PLAN|nr:rRNA maturation RNase YbeY [Caulifigura coniformis]QDT55572.1 Endoribonuclease YbeY [Caulifigura coniformis]
MSTPNARRRPPFEIAIHRSSRCVPLAAARLKSVIRAVLEDEQVASAEISLAIVGDEEIHRVNREHLDHDFPTDVISFLYSGNHDPNSVAGKGTSKRRGAGQALEGELVVSDETARREAPKHGWTAQSELELYVVHGLLHLCGYDDLTPGERRVMRRREREVIARIGQPGA